jgi:hypothetical protein
MIKWTCAALGSEYPSAGFIGLKGVVLSELKTFPDIGSLTPSVNIICPPNVPRLSPFFQSPPGPQVATYVNTVGSTGGPVFVFLCSQ